MEASLVTSYKDSPGNVELARYMQKLMLIIVMEDLIRQAVEFCYLHHLQASYVDHGYYYRNSYSLL